MSFARLSLNNYRGFSSAEFDFAHSGVTLITGMNGSGKSTILEAVYLLCLGRTPRDVRFSSLVHKSAGVSFFRVEGARSGGAPGRSVSFLSGSAVVYHEGDRVIRRSELIGRPPVVLFSTNEMDLITGVPAGRRKFMDRILSQGHPDYLSRLKRYTRTLEERNALLKSASTAPPDLGSLMALDEALAQDGNYLISDRREFLADLVDRLPSQLDRLGAGSLSARIRVETLETARGNLLGALIDHRSQDLAAGHTTVGPHRDDLLFLDTIAGFASPLPASDTLSQGEIRILALALKWIEADRLAGRKNSENDPPILLLDDLFSELDSLRRRTVASYLLDYPGQILLTSCEDLPQDLVTGVRMRVEIS